MASVSHDVQSALQQGADVLKKLPREAVDATEEWASQAHDQLVELVESAGEQVSDLRTAAAEAIRTNPFRAVCAALGIGCVLGITFFRR